MPKLTPFITLTAVAVLLAGCATTQDVAPAADSSPTASATTSPVASSTPEESEAQEPTPTAEPEPTEEPEPVVETPEEPVPTIDPLPAGPEDPFVPPPHGEPNPGTPPVVIADGKGPHSDPDYFLNQTVEPMPNSVPTPKRSMKRGGTLTVVGSDYEPGQEVYVGLGWPQTDYNYIQGPAIAVADQNGTISFPISISTALPAHEYVVMTVPLGVDQTVREASKRYYNITLESN